MKSVAAIAPNSAIELPRLMLAEDSPVEEADEPEEVWLPWKPAPESVAVAVLVVMSVVELVKVAMLMVVFLGRAVLVPALIVPTVPPVPMGITAVVVMVVFALALMLVVRLMLAELDG